MRSFCELGLQHRRMSNTSTMSDLEILSTLGEGSYSKVQLVKRTRDGKLLALKQVNMDKLTLKQRNLALNEIRLLASIRSAFVISYEGSFYQEQTNNLCLLMQYADEGDLETIINSVAHKTKMKGGLPEEFIWRTLIHILQGLEILHKNKIAHRDIKAANIFFAKGVAKLGDLNVSCASESRLYSSKTGTPYYTAPQIWNGEKYTDNCDVWSLGCLVYEMCALLPPFRAQSLPQLFATISQGEYELLSEQYSEDLRTFVRLCLVTNQKDRPTVSDLLASPIIQKKMLLEFDEVKEEAKVQLIKPLKCPKVLRFLNTMLPAVDSEHFDENTSPSCPPFNNGQKTEKVSSIRIKVGKRILNRSQTNKKTCTTVEEHEQQTSTQGIKKQKFRVRSCRRVGEGQKQNQRK